jgi:hypothetical protein
MTATLVQNQAAMVAQLVPALVGINNPRFASVTYRNEHGELAKHSLLLGVDTRKVYERDIVIVRKYLKRPNLTALQIQAAQEILDSLQESLRVGLGFNHRYVHGPNAADTYLPILGGNIFVNKSDNEEDRGTVYVLGYSNNRTVIEAGHYPTVNHRPLTIAKNEVRKLLRSGKIRQFKLRKIARAGMEGKVLVIIQEGP